jgi:hypothetical protein
MEYNRDPCICEVIAKKKRERLGARTVRLEISLYFFQIHRNVKIENEHYIQINQQLTKYTLHLACLLSSLIYLNFTK